MSSDQFLPGGDNPNAANNKSSNINSYSPQPTSPYLDETSSQDGNAGELIVNSSDQRLGKWGKLSLISIPLIPISWTGGLYMFSAIFGDFGARLTQFVTFAAFGFSYYAAYRSIQSRDEVGSSSGRKVRLAVGICTIIITSLYLIFSLLVSYALTHWNTF